MKSHYNILFICTGNSARSIIAEALLNHVGNIHFKAFSAGSQATGTVNPYALQVLQDNKVDTEGLRSKHWNEFAAPEASRMDLVFTVCAKAAGEHCPLWADHPMHADWSVEDPAAINGSEEQIKKAFQDTLIMLKRRIDLLTMLPIEKIDAMALRNNLSDIGNKI